MNEEAKLAAIFPMLAECDLSIQELDIEVTARNSLRRNGVHTVVQLLQLTHTELVALFPHRGLPFYDEIIYKLTCLAQPRETVKTDDACMVERLPDHFWAECKMGHTEKTFNIFQVAGIWKSEEIHTRVIAELLNPNSQFHNMGTAFLEKFLEKLKLDEPDRAGLDKDLFEAKEAAKAQNPTVGATKDGNMIKVKTEVPTNKVRRIDMVIETEHYYLPFEVKIWAGDQKSQLHDYYDYAKNQGKTVPCIYYLTPDGHSPSDWSLGSAGDKPPVCTLSFQEDILPWLDDCIKNTDTQSHTDLVEIMKQLRGNIQGPPSKNGYQPGHMCFSRWGKRDVLDEIYQVLAEHYELTWTECTNRYITFTLNKIKIDVPEWDELEFALRIKKADEDSVSLHLICGLTPKSGKPDYALAGPYIHEHSQEYEDLLADTFSSSGLKNVNIRTSKSTWNRMKVINYKKQEGTCLKKIEEVFSWLQDEVQKGLKKKS